MLNYLKTFARPLRVACSGAIVMLVTLQAPVMAQTGDQATSEIGALKKLAFEELFNLEITTVSRRAERLVDAASAIQVINAEEIRRSGATSLPEALRLAPNLQVAQVNSSTWAISARGFNSTTANKLLVLIDGRSVYTPAFFRSLLGCAERHARRRGSHRSDQRTGCNTVGRQRR